METDECVYPHPETLRRKRIEALEDLICVFNSVKEGCREYTSILVNGGAEKAEAEKFTADLLRSATFKKYPESKAAIDIHDDEENHE